MDNEQNAQCIGRLEHHIHDIFASVRVPGEEFVYNVPSELFNTLDDFCDDQGFKMTIIVVFYVIICLFYRDIRVAPTVTSSR